MSKRIGLSVFLSAVLVSGSVGAQETADKNKRAELILDASGSMWGQIDGEAKILIARRVIGDLLADWPPSTELGVSAYGHRAEGDCSDIEVIVPLGPVDTQAVQTAVNTPRPLGKTPLTQSVREAADRLSESDDGGAIILVTDGLETCGGDPCALGRELAERGVSLKTHVIGFDLAGEDTSALQCLANETGGTYFDAENATGLAEALETARQDVSEPALPVGTVITLRAVGAGDQLLPAEPGVIWSIVREDGNPVPGVAELGSLADVRLQPGTYTVTATHGEDVSLTETIVVEEGQTFTKRFVFADGTTRVTPVLVEGGEPLSGIFSWVVFRTNADGEDKQIAREAGRAPRFTLPSGEYVVEFSSEDLKVRAPLIISADERNEMQIVLNAGWVATEAPSGTSWTAYRLLDNGETQRAASEARSSTRFLLSAGAYEFEARDSNAVTKYAVEIVAGDTLTLPHN